jgi:hypothetical protein
MANKTISQLRTEIVALEHTNLILRTALLETRVIVGRLRRVLAFYADKRNWTNHRDWPDGSDKGCVVLSRDADYKRDMDTPGWAEAASVFPVLSGPEDSA